jgi:hypothetical protein
VLPDIVGRESRLSGVEGVGAGSNEICKHIANVASKSTSSTSVKG